MPIKKKSPTQKQKKLVKAISENLRTKGKTKPLGKLMRESGYSKSQSEKPKDIVESKGFIACLEAAGISDDLIAGKIKEGLALKASHVNTPRYIDMTLKLKKHLNPLGEEAAEAFKNLVQIFIPERDKLPGEE